MERCARCNMDRSQWRGNDGRGYSKDGQDYCCRGCAEGSACTCR